MCTQNTNKQNKGERTKQLTDLVCDSESWLPLLDAAGACFCEGVKIMHKILLKIRKDCFFYQFYLFGKQKQ